MSSEFMPGRYTIGELIKNGTILGHKDGNFGSYYPKITDFGDVGVPLITAKVINNGRINFSEAQKLSFEKANSLPFGFIEENDVLLSHNATVGRVAIVPRLEGRVLIGTSLTYFRVNKERLLPHYLGAFFESRDFQNQLEAVMGLSTRNQVPITAQRLLTIEVPSLAVQTEIANCIQALDNRLNLLRETNATLEAIAQALFKSWFVDFDPVHANAGTQAPSLPPEIQALFPATFTDSPQGPIPEGWNIGFVGDFAEQKKGSVNPLSQPETLFEHFSLPAFDNQQAPVLELGKEIKSNKTPLPKKAVLLSKLNPHIPRLWLPIEYGDTAVCSTEFLAYSPKGASSKEFIYCAFSSEKFTTHLCQLVTGTSNSHQRVKPDQVLLIETVLPPDEIFKQFERITNPIFAQVHKNRLQSQTLATMRDTLLPRLISGQLRLPEAEQAVAAITD